MSAEDAAGDAFREMRRRTFRYFAEQLARNLNDPRALVLHWQLEALR
jgi:hypothetical protein